MRDGGGTGLRTLRITPPRFLLEIFFIELCERSRSIIRREYFFELLDQRWQVVFDDLPQNIEVH
jgi:hypothetical protein